MESTEVEKVVESSKRARIKRRKTLTRKEICILQLVAEGIPSKEIAKKLNLSIDTVKSHLYSISIILNTRNRAHAVMEALRRGWII